MFCYIQFTEKKSSNKEDMWNIRFSEFAKKAPVDLFEMNFWF